MKNNYTIPGFFKDCFVKDNKVIEKGLLGKTLYVYKDHFLKEPGLSGKAVLNFRNGGIYEPVIAGKRLFYVTKDGEVKENGLGKRVGNIPVEWVRGISAPLHDESKDEGSNYKTNTNTSTNFDREIKELKQMLDLSAGYWADYSNCKSDIKEIVVPSRHRILGGIAPALSQVETVVIHSGVVGINPQSIHCSRAYIADKNNPKFTSIDGVLYNKDVTVVVSVPTDIDVSTFRFPETVTTILDYALGSGNLKSFFIQKNIKYIGNISVKKYFEIEEGNTHLKTIDGILYSADGKILYSAPRRLKSDKLIIPDGVKTINDHAFWTAKYEQIVLPNSLKTIKSMAFSDSALKKIFIPDSVDKIEKWAFYRMKGLTIECQAEQAKQGWSNEWALYHFDDYKPTILFGVDNPDF